MEGAVPKAPRVRRAPKCADKLHRLPVVICRDHKKATTRNGNALKVGRGSLKVMVVADNPLPCSVCRHLRRSTRIRALCATLDWKLLQLPLCQSSVHRHARKHLESPAPAITATAALMCFIELDWHLSLFSTAHSGIRDIP